MFLACGDDAQTPGGGGDGEDGGGNGMNSPGRGGPMRPRLDASTPDGPTIHLRDGAVTGSGSGGTGMAGDGGGMTPDASDPACDDGDPCTVDTRGTDGECDNDPVVCTAVDTCHDPGVCNPATGDCSNPRRSDNSPCDDDDACTRTDRCVSGACVGSNPVVCTAEDDCHDPGLCDPASGECSDVHKRDGTACDDDQDCTFEDACEAGRCVGVPGVTSCEGTQCAPQEYLGDGDCDEPLLCAEHNYDNGDCYCSGSAQGYIVGCDLSTCYPVTQLGDGTCDMHLMCYEGNYDDGDCPCDGDRLQVHGCDTNQCYPLSWLRDFVCDPQLNCAATYFDDGDCP
jgi:hypothetical protein